LAEVAINYPYDDPSGFSRTRGKHPDNYSIDEILKGYGYLVTALSTIWWLRRHDEAMPVTSPDRDILHECDNKTAALIEQIRRFFAKHKSPTVRSRGRKVLASWRLRVGCCTLMYSYGMEIALPPSMHRLPPNYPR
jgi:hypothetical protein